MTYSSGIHDRAAVAARGRSHTERTRAQKNVASAARAEHTRRALRRQQQKGHDTNATGHGETCCSGMGRLGGCGIEHRASSHRGGVARSRRRVLVDGYACVSRMLLKSFSRLPPSAVSTIRCARKMVALWLCAVRAEPAQITKRQQETLSRAVFPVGRAGKIAGLPCRIQRGVHEDRSRG